MELFKEYVSRISLKADCDYLILSLKLEKSSLKRL